MCTRTSLWSSLVAGCAFTAALQGRGHDRLSSLRGRKRGALGSLEQRRLAGNSALAVAASARVNGSVPPRHRAKQEEYGAVKFPTQARRLEGVGTAFAGVPFVAHIGESSAGGACEIAQTCTSDAFSRMWHLA